MPNCPLKPTGVLTMSDGRLIQANIFLTGINENYFDIQSVHFKQERTLSKQDNDSHADTAVISDKLAK
ncbi:ABC transporter permease [Pseudoramibacter alactolyticus]|uniref:ABC transporter permease n=1 Tax=Pseudoramibacter alactolyticus TaxID=113287 RepID=UPI0036F29688